MEIAMSLLLMLGGVAVFMFGMKTMNQGMEQGAGSGVYRLFKRINKNRYLDYGIGIGVTAIVQSSSATAIMTVGLANAGVVTVKQGSGIVLGAKVGTTLTAFVFALGLLKKGGFSISAMFCAVAFVGVILIFTTEKESLKKLAHFLIGFGMLFVGLEVMEFAIGGSDSLLCIELSKLFRYSAMNNPILLVVFGIVFTSIMQSSTAVTGIFLTFLATGVINTIDQSFFLIMGANIGTCLDGIMASIGTNANGKRIAVFHVMTSTMGAVLFTIILIIIRAPITNMFNGMFPENPQWSLATYNLGYNLIYTLILLPLLKPLVALVNKIVKDRSDEVAGYRLDDSLLATPLTAIELALGEVYKMAEIAIGNFDRAFNALINEDMGDSKRIATDEYLVDDMTRALAGYFIKISATPISFKDEKLLGGLHHVINDLERIGDHAVNFAKETNYMKQHDAHFLEETRTELQEIHAKLTELREMCLNTFRTRERDELNKISDLHNEVLDLISRVRDMHTERLSANSYSVEVSKSLYTALLSLQRASDHLVNVAFSIGSDTGSKREVLRNANASDQA